ncbi:FxsA family protein [Desulfotomaculum defluvii]
MALLLVVPIIELLIIIQTGKWLGFWVTFSLLFILSLLGFFLIKSQGFSTIRKIKQELSLGQIPTDSLLDGLFILASGLLLLTPGLLTDIIGLSMLFKPFRALIKQSLKGYLIKYFLPGKIVSYRWNQKI